MLYGLRLFSFVLFIVIHFFNLCLRSIFFFPHADDLNNSTSSETLEVKIGQNRNSGSRLFVGCMGVIVCVSLLHFFFVVLQHLGFGRVISHEH